MGEKFYTLFEREQDKANKNIYRTAVGGGMQKAAEKISAKYPVVPRNVPMNRILLK